MHFYFRVTWNWNTNLWTIVKYSKFIFIFCLSKKKKNESNSLESQDKEYKKVISLKILKQNKSNKPAQLIVSF